MNNNDPFLDAAIAEQGMTISVGGPAVTLSDDERKHFEAALAEAEERLRQVALAEYGMPISAGWVPRAEQGTPQAASNTGEGP
jgi:hypothetical protein